MLELDIGVCGRKKKCVGAGISGGGPAWAHEAGGRPGVGRALQPRGQVLAPSAVFSVPKILKYSIKNHTKFAGHLEHFYLKLIKNSDCFINNEETFEGLVESKLEGKTKGRRTEAQI